MALHPATIASVQMRPAAAAILSLTLALLTSVQVKAAGPDLPLPSAEAKTQQDNAAWAELEAQKRALEGDYEGALQAEQEAGTSRRAIEQSETLARSSGARH